MAKRGRPEEVRAQRVEAWSVMGAFHGYVLNVF